MWFLDLYGTVSSYDTYYGMFIPSNALRSKTVLITLLSRTIKLVNRQIQNNEAKAQPNLIKAHWTRVAEAITAFNKPRLQWGTVLKIHSPVSPQGKSEYVQRRLSPPHDEQEDNRVVLSMALNLRFLKGFNFKVPF